MKLKFYADPGHGWLAIPMHVYLKSGMVATPYSYVNRNRTTVYLEEDCDASKFIDVMRERGIEIQTDYKHTNRRSKIRSMERVSVLNNQGEQQ